MQSSLRKRHPCPMGRRRIYNHIAGNGFRKSESSFDRIREKIETYDFDKITISGGIAFIDECIELDKLIEMADKALYKAKRSKI